MDKRAHDFMLLLIALAVAISPLRGALAFPSMPDTGAGAHCAEMQDAMHATHDMLAQTATDEQQGHDHDCDGECCDGACNACVQGTVACSAPTAVTVDIDASPVSRTPLRSFPGLTVHPPFRPPISLHA